MRSKTDNKPNKSPNKKDLSIDMAQSKGSFYSASKSTKLMSQNQGKSPQNNSSMLNQSVTQEDRIVFEERYSDEKLTKKKKKSSQKGSIYDKMGGYTRLEYIVINIFQNIENNPEQKEAFNNIDMIAYITPI